MRPQSADLDGRSGPPPLRCVAAGIATAELKSRGRNVLRGLRPDARLSRETALSAGHATEPNPDEFVWHYMKRTGTSKSPLGPGESLHDRIDAEMAQIQKNAPPIRSFFRGKYVAHISD
jgi:hypothetical protein